MDCIEGTHHWAIKDGIMVDEHMCSISLNIWDVTLHADTILKGGGQIAPTSRLVIYASVLTIYIHFIKFIFLIENQ